MRLPIKDQALLPIADKVKDSVRLSFEDGVTLFHSNDIVGIGYLANIVRTRMHGDRVFFTHNLNLNQTDYCVLYKNCKFCAFAKKIGSGEGYVLTPKQAGQKAAEARDLGVTEIHIVGGIIPEMKIDYFEDLFRAIKKAHPTVMIKALTSVEYDYVARISKISVEEMLMRLREAGLDAIPGGGAEIFAERARNLICPGKISGERWKEIHRIAHGMGFKSNATMLYGHLETLEERVDHLIQLRELQDETGGFLAFVPLAFQPENTYFDQPIPKTTGFDDLKVYAISRLMLDNFDHIKMLYRYVGWKLSEVALNFGVDDLGGTSFEEKVATRAGGTPATHPKEDFLAMIWHAGRTPVEVDSLFRPIEAVLAV